MIGLGVTVSGGSRQEGGLDVELEQRIVVGRTRHSDGRTFGNELGGEFVTATAIGDEDRPPREVERVFVRWARKGVERLDAAASEIVLLRRRNNEGEQAVVVDEW